MTITIFIAHTSHELHELLSFTLFRTQNSQNLAKWAASKGVLAAFLRAYSTMTLTLTLTMRRSHAFGSEKVSFLAWHGKTARGCTITLTMTMPLYNVQVDNLLFTICYLTQISRITRSLYHLSFSHAEFAESRKMGCVKRNSRSLPPGCIQR